MKLRAAFLILALVILAGCAKPLGDPTSPQTPDPDNSSQTSAPPEADSQPTSEATISEISISSADEWNEFATSFNDGSGKYADFITITIHSALDFSGISFVPLYSGFSGIIKGAAELEIVKPGWEYAKIFPASITSSYATGFHNIYSVEDVTGETVIAYGEGIPEYVYGTSQSSNPEEEFFAFRSYGLEYTSPDSLFGLVSEKLTIENLTFANISSEKLSSLFSHSCANLTVQNVAIRNCQLPGSGKAMLAANTDSLTALSLIVYDCGIRANTYAAGLVRWVGSDASFKDVYLYHFDLELYPDAGGSGYPLSFTGVLCKSVFGDASFENIELYGCKVLSAGTAVLSASVSGEILKCKDISVERCSLLGYQWAHGMYPPSELMFYKYTHKPGFEENISFKDCLLNVYVYTSEDGVNRVISDPDTYLARGYTFDNCSFVTLPWN